MARYLLLLSILIIVCGCTPSLSKQEQADLNSKLLAAVENGIHNEASELIESGADINAKTNEQYNETPLMLAAYWNEIEIVKLLLSKGADINTLDNLGWTALMYAVVESNTEIINILLSEGSDVNTIKSTQGTDKWPEGATPLSVAEEIGNNTIINLLKEAGAKE